MEVEEGKIDVVVNSQTKPQKTHSALRNAVSKCVIFFKDITSDYIWLFWKRDNFDWLESVKRIRVTG